MLRCMMTELNIDGFQFETVDHDDEIDQELWNDDSDFEPVDVFEECDIDHLAGAAEWGIMNDQANPLLKKLNNTHETKFFAPCYQHLTQLAIRDVIEKKLVPQSLYSN